MPICSCAIKLTRSAASAAEEFELLKVLGEELP
jgi:hypothetical protein